MDCPKCSSTRLERVVFSVKDRSVAGPDETKKELEIAQCSYCLGVWFEKGELDIYLDSGMSSASAPSLHEREGAPLDSKRGLCPRCGVMMAQAPAPNNPAVRADSCGGCGGLWLDGGELSAVAHSDLPIADRLKAFFNR